jgi:putative nucleotidyltransferase with HDIG domain
MLFIFIAIAVIMVLLLVVLFFRKDETPDDTQKLPAKKTSEQAKYKADNILSKGFYNTDAQQKMLFEVYPSLREIAYFSIPDGVLPTRIEDIDESIQEMIRGKTSSIKPVSANYVNLLNLLRNPESNPGEISTIVSTNPVFSAKILQTVNSAYFGLTDRVTSLGRAITLLGYNNVRALVFQDSLGNPAAAGRPDKPEAYINIWIHSAIVSVCAGYLGKKIFQFSEYDLATIGLLHDIGKYYHHLLEIQGEAASDLPGIIQEEQRYGINHATLGSFIARNWQLSDSIIQCIAYHHYPNFFLPENIVPATYLKESFVVCLSDLIAKVLGYKGQGDDILPIKEEYFKMFHLSLKLSDIITPELTKEIEKTRLTVESYIKVTTFDAL